MTQPAQPSTFVTVVAWLSIIVSSFSVATGILQSAMLTFVMPVPPMTADESAEVPYVMRLIFNNFQGLAFALTAVWAVFLACSIGLLKRREWARLAMVALFGFAAVVSAAMLVLQQAMMQWMFSTGAAPPTDAEAMILIMRTASAVFGLAFVAVFTFLAIKLNAAPVRSEFT